MAQLYARTNHGMKLGLDAMAAVLAALASPDRRLAHVVVAGTNGKGSTSLLLAAALQGCGYRVGHFVSPHLLRFTERIRIDGAELETSAVPDLYQRVLAAEPASPRPLTFFEITTAMALLAFADAAVDIAVLEVGMGGRLDATNVVAKELAVITAVGLDHQQYLGNTVAAIAGEKAGIIPPGGTVVVAPQVPEAMAVITARAAAQQARLIPVTRPNESGGRLRIAAGSETLELTEWPAGAFQRDNVATAAAAFAALRERRFRYSEAALRQAAASFRWPGRYQWLAGTPPTLVDGAHNPPAIAALLAAMAADARIGPDRPLHCVATVLADRSPEQLAPLARRATSLHLAPVSSARSRRCRELAAVAAQHAGAKGHAHESVAAALAAATALARADGGVVLACGSLMIAGDVLAILTAERRDPPVDG